MWNAGNHAAGTLSSSASDGEESSAEESSETVQTDDTTDPVVLDQPASIERDPEDIPLRLHVSSCVRMKPERRISHREAVA